MATDYAYRQADHEQIVLVSNIFKHVLTLFMNIYKS